MKNERMTWIYDKNTLGRLRAMAFLRLLKRMMFEVKLFFSVFHTVELTLEST